MCPDIGFVRRPGTELCYLHVETALDFFEADRTCVRDGGSLVLIESAEEDSFVFSQFYTSGGQREFWIGLYDLDREGDFRYCCTAVDARSTLRFPAPCLAGYIKEQPFLRGSLATLIEEDLQKHELSKFTYRLALSDFFPRWVDGTVPSFLNWAGNAPTENDLSFDCVKYAADGWRVHTDFCATSELPFVCRVPSEFLCIEQP